jgi:protein phosphatase
MGTTLAVLVLGAGQGVIGHTGDSRVYRLRQGQLELLTPDHTFAAALEAAGLPKGAIEMFGHMLTRAIGLPGNATPDIISVDVESDDLFLLCSDGLTKVLDDEELASVLTEREPLRVGNALIEKALRQGGDDNITTLLVWPDAPPGLPSRAASAA